MIPFIKYRFIYFIISALVLVPGMFFLLRYGLKQSIDFTGGTLLEVSFADAPVATESADIATQSAEKPPVSSESLTEIVQKSQFEVSSVQPSGDKQFLLRLKTINQAQKNDLLSSISAELASVQELRFETVGPILGKELLQKTSIAALIAVTMILLYVAWAFKNIRFGISAIIALFHDVLVVVSVFAILGQTAGVEVDVLFVTALLTTMSFSVHDTIVVFDRIRELRQKGAGHTLEETINLALTETMGRSLNNSLTIIFMLLALVLLGGESIRWFAVALLIGTVSGTYSSPFVATPILFFLLRKLKKN